jgi:hypothetical protein
MTPTACLTTTLLQTSPTKGSLVENPIVLLLPCLISTIGQPGLYYRASTTDIQHTIIYPFKNSKRIGDRWYDQISFTYSADMSNKIQTLDSLLFTDKTLKTSKQGFKQALNVTSSYKVLKYFNISPNFNYTEVWGLNQIQQRYDPTVVMIFDTTRYANFPILLPSDKGF